MTRMEEMARRENLAARRAWGQPLQAFQGVVPENIDHKLVPRVMSCLREGLGVEDMQVNGTCKADEARQVIAWMRKIGTLERICRAKKTGQTPK